MQQMQSKQLVLELVYLNSNLPWETLEELSQTSRYFSQLTWREFERRKRAGLLILRTLRRVRQTSVHSLAFLYYRYYPKEHVLGMIRMISWKAKNSDIRQTAKKLVRSGVPLRRYHLASLISEMDPDDVYNVGW